MRTDKLSGIVLALAALGTVLVMAHHPSSPHAAGLGRLVHGAMIALLLAIAWGFLQFSFQRGISRPLISAGLLAFAVSLLGHVAAATINGFAVTALAAQAPVTSHDSYRLAWNLNQAFAGLGVVAGAAAYLLWSFDLLIGDTAGRITGAIGALIGGTIIILVVGGIVHLDLAGAMLIYALQALWALIVGVQMARGKLSGNCATGS